MLSFLAKDKKVLLLIAIQMLYDNNLEIIWAKVHTWGRQIEDIFGVRPNKELGPEQIMTSLKKNIEAKEILTL